MEPASIYQIILSVLTNEATKEEKELLACWLNESENNKHEYERIKQLHASFLIKPKQQLYNTDYAWKNVYKQTVGRKKFIFSTKIRWCAAVVIPFILVGLHLLYTNPEIKPIAVIEQFDQPTLLLDNGKKIALGEKAFSMHQHNIKIENKPDNKLVYELSDSKPESNITKNHLVIPKGKNYQLVLSDGTRIWLNSESELIYPTTFGKEKREITLIGEAFFEVAKDVNKPFYVQTNGVSIKVLGTSFNVSCYEGDKTINTTLVEGSVSIETLHGKQQVISPSEQLIYNKENNDIELEKVDTDLYTSWVQGEYIFKDTPLKEMMTKLERWHDITVVFEEESLKNHCFSLTISKETSIDRFIEIINYTSDIKLERINNIINIKNLRKQ